MKNRITAIVIVLLIIPTSSFSLLAFGQTPVEPTQQTWTEEYEDHQIIEGEHRRQAADLSEQDPESLPDDDIFLPEDFEDLELPQG